MTGKPSWWAQGAHEIDRIATQMGVLEATETPPPIAERLAAIEQGIAYFLARDEPLDVGKVRRRQLRKATGAYSTMAVDLALTHLLEDIARLRAW